MTEELKKRQYFLPLSELIDRLTVTQIKLNILNGEIDDYLDEIDKLSHDIDLIIAEKELSLTSDLIKKIIALAQINLHIWKNKDLMQDNLGNEEKYLKFLKRAHQMNGIRNQLKNGILGYEGIQDLSQIRSNFEVDGLEWNLGLNN